MDNIEKYNKILEAVTEKNRGIETYINLEQLESLTEPLEEDYVVNSNEELTNTHKTILSSYGFDKMLDMYNYALANTSKEEQVSKGKNYDVLDKVKRDVTRGGRKMRTTVYSDIKGTDNKIKVSGGSKEPNKEYGLHLTPVILDGVDNQISTRDLQELNQLTNELKLILDTEQVNNYIELLVDLEGNPRACLYYAVDESIELNQISTDGTVDNLMAVAIHRLIRLALNYEKDVSMGVVDGGESIQLLLSEQYNIMYDQEDNKYHATYEELVDSFGEDYIRLKGKR